VVPITSSITSVRLVPTDRNGSNPGVTSDLLHDRRRDILSALEHTVVITDSQRIIVTI